VVDETVGASSATAGEHRPDQLSVWLETPRDLAYGGLWVGHGVECVVEQGDVGSIVRQGIASTLAS
jgi:hypothetical protein